MIRVEQMSGTRVPYIALVEIPILQDETDEREQDFLVTQDGPFVAVRRWATFLSSLQFEVTDPVTGQKYDILPIQRSAGELIGGIPERRLHRIYCNRTYD